MLSLLAILLLQAAPVLDVARLPLGSYVPAVSVGIVGGPIIRSANVIDLTSTYGLDATGHTNCGVTINNAISGASSNTVLLLRNGTYKTDDATLQLWKPGVTFRGETPGLVRIVNTTGQLITVGSFHQANAQDIVTVFSGATRGSTNIALSGIIQALAGDMLEVWQTNPTNDLYQVWNVHGYQNEQAQQVQVLSKTAGTNLVIWPPLVKDYTNTPTVQLRSWVAAGATWTPPQMSGVEGIIFSMTNTVDHSVGSATYEAWLFQAINCWFLECGFEYGNNYSLLVQDTANCYLRGCKLSGRGVVGPNHSGLIMNHSGGNLIENSSFNALDPAFEINHGSVYNAIYGCYFTNNLIDILFHETHQMFNLFEADVLKDYFEADGYFGSTSEMTLYRCAVQDPSMPLRLKRFNTYYQMIGNVLGISTGTYHSFSSTTNGDDHQILQSGYPNIGNSFYSNSVPNVAWNFPGTTYESFNHGTVSGAVTLIGSDQTATTNLLGNFAWVESDAANPIYSAFFTLGVQDGSSTNNYYGGTDGLPFLAYSVGTSSNLLVRSPVTVHTGDRVLMMSESSYQQLQSSNIITDLVHANYDYFNHAQTFAGGYDTNIYAGILYSNTAPAWWYGSYPAIVPQSPPSVGVLRAELNFEQGTWGNGMTPTNTPPPIIIGGDVRLRGGIKLKVSP